MKVLITDAKYKMALAPLRSLRRAGYETVCGDRDTVPDKELLGTRSKACGEKLSWPETEDPAVEIARKCDPGDVVLPLGRPTLRSFAAHPELGEKVRFLVSEPETLERADDKGQVFELAKELGVPVPDTWTGLSEDISYPVILKYRDGEALGLKSWERYALAADKEALRREYARMEAVSPGVLIQKYLSGRDMGAAVVMDRESRPVDFLLYVSDLEYPLSGGPTCLCRTVFDRQLLHYACDMLRALQFKGVAMLDFKGSLERPCLLEINPRVWGSAALADISGATFFESYVKACLGTAAPLDLNTCRPAYRLDARMKFTPHIYLAAMKELRSGKGKPGLSHLAAALSPKVRDGVFARGDNRPGRRYMKNLIGKSTGE